MLWQSQRIVHVVFRFSVTFHAAMLLLGVFQKIISFVGSIRAVTKWNEKLRC